MASQIAAPSTFYGMLSLQVRDLEELAKTHEIRPPSDAFREHAAYIKRDFQRVVGYEPLILFGRFYHSTASCLDVALVIGRPAPGCGHWMAKSILSQAGPDSPLTEDDVQRLRALLHEV